MIDPALRSRSASAHAPFMYHEPAYGPAFGPKTVWLREGGQTLRIDDSPCIPRRLGHDDAAAADYETVP